MENPPRSKHPMFIVAAVAATITSLAATDSFAGFLPARQDTVPAPQGAVSLVVPSPASVPAPAEKAPAPQVLAQQAYDAPIPQPPPRRVTRQTSGPDPAYSQRSYSAGAPINDNEGYNENPRAQGQYQQQAPNYQTTNTCRDCATVENIREVKQEGEGSGLGAIGGGVVGGLLGNQIGAGRGRTVGAVVGAVGGAYAGNEVEKNVRSSRRYEITVRFDDGNTRVFTDS